MSQTGGGGPSCVLNENELRLLAIIGTIAVIGVTEVERGIVSKKRQIHIFFVPLDPFHSSFVTDSYTKYLTSFIVGPRRNTDNFFKWREGKYFIIATATYASIDEWLWREERIIGGWAKKKPSRKIGQWRKKPPNNIRSLQNLHVESLQAMKEISKHIGSLAESIKLLAESNLSLVEQMKKRDNSWLYI